MIRYIPNILTSLNLVSGFFAIILTANGSYTAASWLIAAAMVFDFSDGFAARMLKAYSDIGRELDSLADVVSFGAAPAYLVFVLLRSALNPASDGSGMLLTGSIPGNILLLTTAIMPVCAALRLAIFNVDTEQSTSFRGLPTPANAIAVISLVLGAEYSQGEFAGSLLGSPLFLVTLTIVLSLLMVSRLPLLSLKMKNLKLKGNEGRYILAVFIIIALAAGGPAAAVLIIPLYIAASMLSLLF